jgi:hypothetical protein
MAEFEDDKFIVIPTKYIERLSMTARIQLVAVMGAVEKVRVKDKVVNLYPEYYVVNRDEPYAEDVLSIILRGEERKERENGKG